MTYQPLERAGLIEPYRVPQAEITDLLEIARRDVKTAQELMNIDLDWALIAAYNAALLHLPSSILPPPLIGPESCDCKIKGVFR